MCQHPIWKLQVLRILLLAGLHVSTWMRVDGLHAFTWMRVDFCFLFNILTTVLPCKLTCDQKCSFWNVILGYSLNLGDNVVEVRDSWTGYFMPASYGTRVWSDGKIVGASSPPSPSAGDIWKMPKYYEMRVFSKRACHVWNFQKC